MSNYKWLSINPEKNVKKFKEQGAKGELLIGVKRELMCAIIFVYSNKKKREKREQIIELKKEDSVIGIGDFNARIGK